jgi:hypothetical protein
MIQLMHDCAGVIAVIWSLSMRSIERGRARMQKRVEADELHVFHVWLAQMDGRCSHVTVMADYDE